MIFRCQLFRPLLLLSLLVCIQRAFPQSRPKATGSGPSTLFELLPPSRTGISFTNRIYESDSLNILNQANIYNGGGVGIGDFNNDGLPDIFLSGNMVSSKLYLNKGGLKFQDITEQSGVGGQGHWCTGASIVDINGDGLPDIYVSASFRKDPLLRTNLLYINQGPGKDGIPIFKESAKAYGIADTGFSTQGVFFDYDHDGDLDLYIVTNQLNDPKTPIRFRPKVVDGSALNNDRLYRNNGDGTFTNVTREAGILIEGWGHAACISDFNQDGWPDIYVSNDFVSNDLLYINNRDGTFTNRLGEYFSHTGWNAMGTDVIDINNDGLPDLISLEMLPENNLRKKRMLAGNEYYNYFNSSRFGYTHQYVRNTLQLNRGMGPEGHPVYSEIGFLAGVYETDWSWCPLVADFDNDGFRDLVITNGLPRDVTDLDYVAFNNGQGGGAANLSLKMVDSLPVVRLPGYAFKNSDGIQFRNTSLEWGFTHPSFSNGVAYADLDNDGDLDLVINNINDPAFVYENTLHRPGQKTRDHWLSVIIRGEGLNRDGIGASLRIYYDSGHQQYYEHQPTRGYMSTDDYRAHFGIGEVTVIDSLRVRWPDGKSQLLTAINPDRAITVNYKDAVGYTAPGNAKPVIPLFTAAPAEYGIRFKHVEKDVIDYNIQPALPHKLSQYGPGIAVGDIDGNGYEDFYIGGSVGHRGIFFMQDARGNFTLDSSRILVNDNHPQEDMGVLFFDADNDGDLDMYVVSGSYELPPGQAASQDVLYINDGKGVYTPDYAALPKMFSNGSCVRAADFDGDGDLDLFVAGRVVSGAYPSAPRSYLLMNHSGSFFDVTKRYCPELERMGMITDALWSDFDQDGKVDLVLTGEWMPVTFLKNTGNAFVSINETSGVGGHVGWWNSLVAGDFDNDGDIDYIAGNLGLNSNYKATPQEPMFLYAKDLDENGLLDAMVFCYMKAEDGSRKPFPMTSRDDMVSQMISVRKRYPTYKSYGLATMDDLWSKKDREGALLFRATDMASSYIENLGNGHFAIRPLPVEAQYAPIYGMAGEDIDGDGNLDLVTVGNDYGMDPYSGRHDAYMGLCMKGDGKGNFKALTIAESGFYVKGDAKGLATIHTARDEDLLIATQNQDSLVVFSRNVLAGGGEKSASTTHPTWINLLPGDFCADIIYKDLSRRHIEFYYGSTYLSQSSRKLRLEKEAAKVIITDYRGNRREVGPAGKNINR
ncbi:MAG TPA: VCBS repeat-containing protein [Puia sp.]|nr:VCBS repeat-containing protein [Puia sp.]